MRGEPPGDGRRTKTGPAPHRGEPSRAGPDGPTTASEPADPHARDAERSILALQRASGNAAVGRLVAVQRQPAPATTTSPTAPAAKDPAVDEILKRRKVPDVVAAIKDIVWVHPNSTGNANEDLEKLWGSYGSGLPDAVASHLDIWWSSARLHPQAIAKLPHVSRARTELQNQTMARARGNLDANEKLIRAEMTKFGLNETTDPNDPRLAGAGNALITPGVKSNLEDLKRLASVAKKQKQLQADLRKKPITWERTPFSPDQEPDPKTQLPAFTATGKDEPGAPSLWRATKQQWDHSQQLLGLILNSNPAIFLSIDNPAALDRLVNADPKQQPAQMLQDVWNKFKKVLKNIDNARSGLGTVDYRELKPIHDAMRTTGPWTHKFSQWIIDEAVENYQNTQYWVKLGLEAAMLGALVVAEIATMGGATFLIATGLGFGIAAYKAAESAQKANEMKALGGSAARADLALVYRGQITAAEAEAEADMLNLALTAGGSAFGAASRVGEAQRIALAAKRTEALKQRFAAEIAEDAKLQKQIDALDDMLKKSEPGNATKVESRLAELQDMLPHSSPAPQAGTLVPGASGNTFKWGVPERERVGLVKNLTNTRLSAEGVPAAEAVPLDGTATGLFNHRQWELGISKQLLARDGLTPAEYAGLLDTINHEARHAKQYWDIARLKAGQGMSEAQLVQLGYPNRIAKAAMNNKMLPTDAQAALVQTWADSFFGATGSAHRNAVYQARDAALAQYLQVNKAAKAAQAAYDALPATAGASQRNIALLDSKLAYNRSQQAYLKYDQAFREYLKLPEEVDARAVAGLQTQGATGALGKLSRPDVQAATSQVRLAEGRVAAAHKELSMYKAVGASEEAMHEADVARALAEDDLRIAREQLTAALAR